MQGFVLATVAVFSACALAVPFDLNVATDTKLYFRSEKVKLQTYSFKNCLNRTAEIAYFKYLIFKPDPIELPGTLKVSFSVDIKSAVTAPLKGDVLLERKVGSAWIKIPCVLPFGSCSYNDICELLAQIPQCPPQFVKAGLSCTCPFKQGSHTFPETSFEVPVGILPPGDYRLRANLSSQGKPVGCYDITATLA